VLKFASFFGINQSDLLFAWLSDKLVSDLGNETLAEQAPKVAEEKLQYLKAQNNG